MDVIIKSEISADVVFLIFTKKTTYRLSHRHIALLVMVCSFAQEMIVLRVMMLDTMTIDDNTTFSDICWLNVLIPKKENSS